MLLKEKEYETKVLISQKTFNNLLKNYKLNIADNKLIKNNYFDTNDLDVFHNSAVFRIRELSHKIIISFKRALQKNELIEYNQNISEARFIKIKKTNFSRSKFKKILLENNINIEKVGFLGSLITHRWKIKYKGANIFVDHCLYNGIEDYEIECEAKNALDAEKIMIQFCKENEINYSVSSLAKYARFLKSRSGGI